jgi:plastocyanin
MPSLRQLRRLFLVGVPVIALGAASAPRATPPELHPADRGATAAVEGRVEIARALTTRRPRFRIYAEPGVGARPAVNEANERDERRNIIVYIERVPAGATSAPTERAVLRQHGERFTPHVLPVLRGSTVDFPNDDVLFHNVFSLSRAKEFDLGRYPRGASRSVTFDRPGIVQVFCHIHSDMSAVVLVLDNPYFAVPDAEGRYSIPDLQPGDYTLVAWHERIRPVAHRLHLEPGQLARVDFTIPLPAADAARER